MGGLSGISVLIVDDEKTVRESFGACLRDYGLDARAVSNATEALEILSAERFDVALIDMQLPEMDGASLIMKAYELAPQMRFLIHTGQPQDHIAPGLERIGIGLENILLKPQTDLSRVVERIRNLAKEGTGRAR